MVPGPFASTAWLESAEAYNNCLGSKFSAITGDDGREYNIGRKGIREVADKEEFDTLFKQTSPRFKALMRAIDANERFAHSGIVASMVYKKSGDTYTKQYKFSNMFGEKCEYEDTETQLCTEEEIKSSIKGTYSDTKPYFTEVLWDHFINNGKVDIYIV